jgi:hypothetical protein
VIALPTGSAAVLVVAGDPATMLARTSRPPT